MTCRRPSAQATCRLASLPFSSLRRCALYPYHQTPVAATRRADAARSALFGKLMLQLMSARSASRSQLAVRSKLSLSKSQENSNARFAKWGKVGHRRRNRAVPFGRACPLTCSASPSTSQDHVAVCLLVRRWLALVCRAGSKQDAQHVRGVPGVVRLQRTARRWH